MRRVMPVFPRIEIRNTRDFLHKLVFVLFAQTTHHHPDTCDCRHGRPDRLPAGETAGLASGSSSCAGCPAHAGRPAASDNPKSRGMTISIAVIMFRESGDYSGWIA